MKSSMISQRENFVPPTLQITSMMDMFTIILFFLLFSFSDKPDDIQLDKALSLPSSSAEMDYDNAIKLMISAKTVSVDGKVIATLQGQKIQGMDENALENSALYQTLKRLKDGANIKSDARNDDDVKMSEEPHVLLFCDENLPYAVIQQLVAVTAAAGFANFQLMVMEQ